MRAYAHWLRALSSTPDSCASASAEPIGAAGSSETPAAAVCAVARNVFGFEC